MSDDKHYEVNFVDCTKVTVKGELPPDLFYPLFSKEPDGELKVIEVGKTKWWTVTLLVFNHDTKKYTPHGRIHANFANVTYIKEC